MHFITFIIAGLVISNAGLSYNKNDLNYLYDQINQLKQSAGRGTHLDRKSRAENYLSLASSYYREKSYHSTLLFCNLYLSISTQKDSKTLFEIQKIRSKAYQNLNLHLRAIDSLNLALQNYFSLDVTDNTEIVHLIQLLKLSIDKVKNVDQLKIRKLLSAIGSLKLAKEDKFDILFQAAKIAFKLNMFDLSSQWLANIRLHTKYENKKAEALYLEGLIAYEIGSFPTSLLAMKKILEIKNLDENIKSKSIIAASRVYAKMGEFQKALNMNNRIQSSNQLFSEIASERVFYLYKLQQYSQARTQAGLLLAQGNMIKSISRHLPYLELIADESSLAKAKLETSIKNNSEFIVFLKDKEKNHITQVKKELISIKSKSEHLIKQSPIVLKALNLYMEIEEQRSLVAQHASELNNLYFSISKKGSAELRPDWKGELRQLDFLTDSIFEFANKLAKEELNSYQTKISRSDLQLFSMYENKLTAYSGEYLKFKSKNIEWRSYSDGWKHQQSLLDLNKSIYKNRAVFAAIILMAQQHPDIQQQVENLKNQIISDNQSHSDLFNQIQNNRLHNINNTINANQLIVKTRARALILDDKEDLLKKYRQNTDSISSYYFAHDYKEDWRKYKYLISESLAMMKSIKRKNKNRVNILLNNLEKYKRKLQLQMSELNKLEHQTDIVIKRSFPTISSYYFYQASKNLSYLRKWMGDLASKKAANLDKVKIEIHESYLSNQHYLRQGLDNAKKGML